MDTTLNMEKAAPVGQPCGYDHNMLLDNSSEKFRLACCLRTLIANPNCRKIRIATGYWDLPGTNLVYDELKSFLERGGELDLLIGEDPHIHKGHLASLPAGENFPDFYICQDFEKLTEALRPVAQLLLDYVTFENDSDDASKIKIHIYGKDENERQFLHAKCYIFTDMTGDYARGIVGSSNFTAKGLGGTDGSTDGGNSELNYLETDPVRIWETAATSPVRTHADWFNEKWENSRPWNGRFIWLIKRSAIGHTLVDPPTRNVCAPSRPFTPYETYIKLLQHQYGAIVDAKAATAISSYLPSEKIQLEYQIDAVKQCFAAMRNRGGFMLADVVGLGKTIIAVLVIRHFLDCPDDRPSKVLVVTPPAVKTAWTDTLAEFSIPPAAVDFVTTGSIGNLVETAIGDVDDMDEEADDGDFADALKHENYGLIVIDESHKFRNSTTAMYKALDDLIHRSIDETAVCPYIGLLSATPQNNSPADIKNQIYLFARDRKHSAFDGVPDGGNLEAYFSKVEKTYKELREKAEEILSRPGGTPSNEMDDVRRQLRALADDVRNKVMNDVLVRRTRTDVQKYYADDIERKLVIFSEAKATVEALCDVVESCGWHGRVLKITAKNRKEKELAIRENFDANFAGEWKNDYDVIVTTEVLAEGVNLHRANFILNYDAPWNATRLMQRIGRVNRIGTQADFVYVYNFMPSAEGDEYIRLVGKAYVKLQSFQSLLGEDSKIFTNAETVETHNLNAITAEDEESAFAPYIAELKTYKAANPERYAQIEAAESVEVAVSTVDSAWFTVAPPHGSGLFVQVPTGGEAKVVPLIDMLAACKVQADASAVDLPENWKTLKDEAITAYIHHQAPVKSYFKKSKAVKGAMAYADRLKGDPQFDDADAGEMKKLLTLAKSLAEGGNVDVVQKLNAFGARFYSPQMELFPVTPAEICGAIREAFSAIAAAHEAQKGKPCIVTGLSK